jgi:hypothetical protein
VFRFIPLLLVLPVSTLAAPAPDSLPPQRLEFSLDGDMSPEAGASNLLSLYGLFGRLEDHLISPRLPNEQGFLLRSLGVGVRLGKLVFLDPIPSYYADVLQHEVFGHGYRARQFEYEGIRYHFYLPPPFGRGGAYTQWQYPAGVVPTPDQA